jgi:hypothetical protein
MGAEAPLVARTRKGLMTSRLSSTLVATLLSIPLIGLTAWVVRGALASHPSASSDAPVPQPHPEGPAGVWPGLPQHRVDLPAERLEEQVDGAAEALRASGCRRLVAWRFEKPPADAEALFFATAEGARAVLESEAGSGRTPGPGDEAQVSEQAVYFRRGSTLVRVFLDPGASAAAGELLAHAQEVDRAIRERGSK